MNSSGKLPQYNKEEPLQIEDEDSVNYQDHHASKDLIRHCNYYGIARKSSIKQGLIPSTKLNRSIERNLMNNLFINKQRRRRQASSSFEHGERLPQIINVTKSFIQQPLLPIEEKESMAVKGSMNRARSKIIASKGLISDSALSQKQSNFSNEKFRDKMSQILHRQYNDKSPPDNMMKQSYYNAKTTKSNNLSRHDQNRTQQSKHQLEQLGSISNPWSIYQQKQLIAASQAFDSSRQLPNFKNNDLQKQQEQEILATSLEQMFLPLTSSIKMTSQDRSKRGRKQNNINININIIQNAVQEYQQNHNVTNVFYQQEPPSTKSSVYEDCNKFKNIRNIDGLSSSVSRSTDQRLPNRDHTPPLKRANFKIKSKQIAVPPPAEVKLEDDKKSSNRRNIIKKQYSTQSEYKGITKAEKQAAIRFNELMNFNWNDKIQKLNNDINQVRDLEKRHKMAMIEQPVKKAEKVVHFNLPGEEKQQ